VINKKVEDERKVEAEKLQQSIYARMTPSEKWQEVLRLRQTAWLMKRAFLKDQHPDLTSDEIEEELRKIFLYAST
jgi:hypothetical protein